MIGNILTFQRQLWPIFRSEFERKRLFCLPWNHPNKWTVPFILDLIESPWEVPQARSWFRGQSLHELSGQKDELSRQKEELSKRKDELSKGLVKDIPVVGENYLGEYQDLPWLSLQQNYPQSWQKKTKYKTGSNQSVLSKPLKPQSMQGQPIESSEPKYGEFEVQNLSPGSRKNSSLPLKPEPGFSKPYSEISNLKPARKPKIFWISKKVSNVFLGYL